MLAAEIATQRFHHQQLVEPAFANPANVVGWLGAVQSQDYAGAKWAVAQRTQGNMTDAAIEQAFTDGAILRTHVLRPTWHFVTPADIRWLLTLTAPRVNALNAYMYRQLALDDALFLRSHAAIEKALAGGRHLTRTALGAALAQVGIIADGMRLGYIVHRAELDALICSGARQGKQFTYALLDERVPPVKPLDRDEALDALVKRYFTSHGPATAQDFVWWSGLTVGDAKLGLDLVGAQLSAAVINDQHYWFSDYITPTPKGVPVAYLLPNYDEAVASYKDRSATVDAVYANMWDKENGTLSHHLVIDGQIVGSWQRTFKKGTVAVEIKPFATLTAAAEQAIHITAQRYGEFLEMPVVLA